MEDIELLLTPTMTRNFRIGSKKVERKQREELILFLDALSLFLLVGYDLSYSWNASFHVVGAMLSPSMKQQLGFDEENEQDASITSRLLALSDTFSICHYRFWFRTIRELYVTGASLSGPLAAISDALRKDRERDLEHHFRNLPSRLNIIMLVFFLPPTFLLLFIPLWLGLRVAL